MHDKLCHVSCVMCRVGRALVLVTGFWLLVTGVRAETLRDPFMFGSRQGGTAEGPEMVLMGVLWDATRPLAIVGDQEVGVGDQVADWQVVEIQENGIIVQRGDRRETVALGNSLPTD